MRDTVSCQIDRQDALAGPWWLKFINVHKARAFSRVVCFLQGDRERVGRLTATLRQ